MKCPNCQTENSAGAKFCMKCGSKLEAAVQSAPTQGSRTYSPMSDAAEKEKTGSSDTVLMIVAAVLGVAAIAGIGVAVWFYLRNSADPELNMREEKSAQTQSAEESAAAGPLQEMLENMRYTELVDTLLAMEDLEFYSDEDGMREYLRQALVGHMTAVVNEAEALADAGDFEGAYGKIDAEAAYRDNLKGQGRVYPFTEESAELEEERERLTSRYADYVRQNTQTMAEQMDLGGMESMLAQASGRLSGADCGRIAIDAYYTYVIKAVDQMQAEGKNPYEIMNLIDSYFEKTNYHGYLMELWDNQNAQSGRTGTWRTEVTHQGSDGFLLNGSDGRYINKSELGNFTNYELYLARWEIYARHNRKFADSALNTYFSQKSWYNAGESQNFQTFDDSILNEYEKGNIRTIIEYEKECGYR